jgi:hypothetical protein
LVWALLGATQLGLACMDIPRFDLVHPKDFAAQIESIKHHYTEDIRPQERFNEKVNRWTPQAQAALKNLQARLNAGSGQKPSKADVFLQTLIAQLSLRTAFEQSDKTLPENLSTLLQINTFGELVFQWVHVSTQHPTFLTPPPLEGLRLFIKHAAPTHENWERVFGQLMRLLQIDQYKGTPLGEFLGVGGSGVVFTHPSQPKKVYKIFFGPFRPDWGLLPTVVVKREIAISHLFRQVGVDFVLQSDWGPWPDMVIKNRYPDTCVPLDFWPDSNMEPSVLARLQEVVKRAGIGFHLKKINSILLGDARLGRSPGKNAIVDWAAEYDLDVSPYNIAIDTFNPSQFFVFDF